MIPVIGISIAYFLAFLLFSKKGKTLADTILMLWLVVTGIHLSLYYCHIPSNNYPYPHLLGVSIPIPFLHGPFLFLYTATLTGQRDLKNYKWLAHFALPIGFFLYLIPFFTLSASEKVSVFQNEGLGYERFLQVSLVLLSLSGFGYIVWSSLLLRRHKRRIQQHFSFTDKINLDWVQYLISGLCLIWVVALVANDEWIFKAVVAFVLFIGYFGIKQVGIFTYTDNFLPPQYQAVFEEQKTEIIQDTIQKTIENEDIIKKKYQKSGLTDAQAEHLQKDLAHLMISEQLFKNSELTLTHLAEKLNVHPNYLSQVINEKEGVSFYDYVNYLRIEEFKRLVALPESKQYTLLSLAFDCGFNSKSSFNRYFKKIMDLSPSEYMQKLS